MPAEPLGLEHSRHSPQPGQRRRSERRACDLRIAVRIGSGEVGGRLLNVSAGGIGAEIDTLVPLKPGTQFHIAHPQLGDIACVVRWAMHPRYGAEYQAPRQALERISAFYDTLPPAPGQIL